MYRKPILFACVVYRILPLARSTVRVSSIPLSKSSALVSNLPPGFLNHNRTMSSCSNKTADYESVLQATTEEDTYIIDVREPDELTQTGSIPNSLNIPLAEVDNALKCLTATEFEQKYGRAKPKESTRIIFTCRSGKRATTAAQTAMKNGYTKYINGIIYNNGLYIPHFCSSQIYLGSWLDWETHVAKE